MYKGSRTLWIQNCSNSYESTTNRQLKPIQLVTYLLNTAFTETLTGIVAISVPPSAMLGSITWHFNIGWSFTTTSLLDLKITCTAVCLSWGARVPFEGITENRLVTLGFIGSLFSNVKLEDKRWGVMTTLKLLRTTVLFELYVTNLCMKDNNETNISILLLNIEPPPR